MVAVNEYTAFQVWMHKKKGRQSPKEDPPEVCHHSLSIWSWARYLLSDCLKQVNIILSNFARCKKFSKKFKMVILTLTCTIMSRISLKFSYVIIQMSIKYLETGKKESKVQCTIKETDLSPSRWQRSKYKREVYNEIQGLESHYLESWGQGSSSPDAAELTGSCVYWWLTIPPRQGVTVWDWWGELN